MDARITLRRLAGQTLATMPGETDRKQRRVNGRKYDKEQLRGLPKVKRGK
jgi:hypothetical protein